MPAVQTKVREEIELISTNSACPFRCEESLSKTLSELELLFSKTSFPLNEVTPASRITSIPLSTSFSLANPASFCGNPVKISVEASTNTTLTSRSSIPVSYTHLTLPTKA